MWELDYTWQHIGCNGNLNEIGIYKINDASSEIGDFTYEIRSGHDPLIYMRETTDGKINFGLPGTTWKIMGFVIALISIYLFIQPAIYFKKRVSGELPESPKLVEFSSLRK